MRMPPLAAAAFACGLALTAFAAQAQTPPPPAPAQKGPERSERREPPRPRFTAADREAFLDARIAALHAGLKLTPDQEKLWPKVEEAVRASAKAAAERRESMRRENRPADMLAWLRRIGDEDIAKGQAFKTLADAAAPLYQTLTEEQKRRLPPLLHGFRPHGFGPGMMMGRGPGPMGQGPMGRGPMGPGRAASPSGAPDAPAEPAPDEDDDAQ